MKPNVGSYLGNPSDFVTSNPTELVVTAGATVIKHGPIVDYRGSNPAQPAIR
jgi:hypothetical protein